VVAVVASLVDVVSAESQVMAIDDEDSEVSTF
jgi:hypothetical protein